MSQQTPLNAAHRALGAKMVDFAGWDMPVQYDSVISEHNTVREAAGMFDVSHMTVVDFSGDKTRDFLRYLLANDVDKMQVGKALYSCMLKADGGVLDDLIVYMRGEADYRIVFNAATRDKVLPWLAEQNQNFAVTITEQPQLAMIAVQGPNAREHCHQVLPGEVAERIAALKPFTFADTEDYFIARTGYTGEDGYEMMLPPALAQTLWQALLDNGVKPIGLAARDTLRLEAGLNLYGQDMDETVTPLVSNLSWTVALADASRDFIGREALQAQKVAGPAQRLVGLVLETRGVPRTGQAIQIEGKEVGAVTSGTFSPTMQQGIAIARIPVGDATHCDIMIRQKALPARIVKLPFVRGGKVLVS